MFPKRREKFRLRPTSLDAEAETFHQRFIELVACQGGIADQHAFDGGAVDIAENRLDLLIFFMDPLSAQPHEADVQAVVRLATLYNVVLATNTAAADFIVSSPLFAQAYEPADGAPD